MTWLGDVLPRLTGHDRRNALLSYAESARKIAQRGPGSMKTPQLYNRIRSELGGMVLCAEGYAASTSPLAFLVRHILCVSAEKQVVRVNASGVIAAVQDMKAVRDCPNVDLVRDSMGLEASVSASKRTVAVSVRKPLPFPTRIISAFREVLAETLFQRSESHSIGALTTACRCGAGLGAVGVDMEGCVAHGTNDGDVARIGVHFWSLLNRFRGAMPRAATNSAGAFCVSSLYQNPYEMGVSG